ncbi:SIR2 family protein [Rahnella inusitata]|uniref:SIR2 family protein n=1 Tax=Rahnella inusitata TaxID=58169 RepID=UPI0039AEDE14
MMENRDISSFIDRFVKELEEENAAVFLGAGFSVSAGFVNWKELLRPLAQELGVNVDEEHDLVSLAQYYFNGFGRHRINQQLITSFPVDQKPTESHLILSRLPIDTFWTTNYDRLIESALVENGKIADVKYTVKQLATTKPRRDAVVYKMHGDIENPDSAVLIKDDYERYALNYTPFINALSGDLVSKTFLFLGFSFTDPNLDLILSRIRIFFDKDQRGHYCIFKKCHREEFENDNDFKIASLKQGFVITDLKRFNIQVLLVEQYSDIKEILTVIEKRLARKAVFISGSADCFGEWDSKDTELALSILSSTLIKKGYKIITGVGIGIGNMIISGAISQVYRERNKSIEDHILMRPFPQYVESESEKEKVWDLYRRDLIKRSGIALFILGNTNDGEKINLADGVRKEFTIAKELGIALVPIGSSGFMAKELWNEVRISFESFYPDSSGKLKECFEDLGKITKNPNEIISSVVNFLDQLSLEYN